MQPVEARYQTTTGQPTPPSDPQLLHYAASMPHDSTQPALQLYSHTTG